MNIKLINAGGFVSLHTTEIVCQMPQCMIFQYKYIVSKQKHRQVT